MEWTIAYSKGLLSDHDIHIASFAECERLQARLFDNTDNSADLDKDSQKWKEMNFLSIVIRAFITVKSVLGSHSKIDKIKILITYDSSMNVESIAECSL